MSKIVIGIACHKPSELPDNDLYLPIHVGAKLAKKELGGLQRDDEGDNISEKNPFYCELTAQYWLWKNVDADYYGLCHYRRFMSFAPTRFTNLSGDNRKQVIIHSLNAKTRELCFLDNADAMRKVIEGYDVVATEEQDLSRVYTPRGYQPNVYEHFAAHDHDLINVNDLHTMLAIVQEKHPQYYPALMEYLNKPFFRGYNCFVMRRELFFELCAYEFDVLAELEKHVDMSTYDVTKTRLYGFMAEILYSGFVYHLRTREHKRVKDVQMLFFEDTDESEVRKPVEGALPICFTSLGAAPFMLDVTLSSFIEHMDRERKYDITVLHSVWLTSYYKSAFKAKVADCPNLSIRFVNWDSCWAAHTDYEDKVFSAPHIYLAEEFPLYSKMLVVSECTLFRADCAGAFDVDMGEMPIAAARDIRRVAAANSTYGNGRAYFERELGVSDPLLLFHPAVVLMDLEKLRSAEWRERIAKRLYDVDEQDAEPRDVLDVAFYESAAELPQHWNWNLTAEPGFKGEILDAPKALLNEYKSEEKTHAIVSYLGDDPWWPQPDDFYPEYWGYAGKSEFFPFFLQAVAREQAKVRGGHRLIFSRARELFNKAFPLGTKRNDLLHGAFPYGSQRYKLLRKFYH